MRNNFYALLFDIGLYRLPPDRAESGKGQPFQA